MSDRLTLARADELTTLTGTRPGETKLGETVCTVGGLEALKNEAAPFVLLGIREDIGIRANLGKGGATDCWNFTIKALLNVQSNRFLSGENVIVLGALEFPDLLEQSPNLDASKAKDLDKLRQLTAQVDEAVTQVIREIVAAQKIPVIIGGGHNNAYGNIRGTSEAIQTAVSVLNIDPHTDYRSKEGRHSGNGFRYAREEGFLNRYAVYGLHEGYNSESVIDQFQKDSGLHFQSFESILHQNEEQRYRGFTDLINWFGHEPLGLELDLDCLTRFPVSALNPSGFSLNEVRALVRSTASLTQPHYFHICEGSPGRAANDLEKEMLGKSMAYLISDFIKAYF